MTAPDDELVAWLLEGDPSIRWRVHRDILASPASTVAAERARVAAEGWGAKLISLQDPDGRWGGGDYSPKWISTTYTLLHLLWLGLPPRNPAALAGCERLWEWQSRWRVPETCIASMLVRLTAAHGYDAERLDDVVGYLLGQQLNDGGWNCAAHGDLGKHSSFHTSILALEALDAYQRAGGRAATDAAQARGRAFFLRHGLYKSHRTGQVAIRGSAPLSPAAPMALRRTARARALRRRGRPPRRTAGRCYCCGAACPSSRWPMVDLRRLSRPDMVPDGGTGSEPVEHPASAACPGLVERNRLSCWLRPATLAPCVTW